MRPIKHFYSAIVLASMPFLIAGNCSKVAIDWSNFAQNVSEQLNQTKMQGEWDNAQESWMNFRYDGQELMTLGMPAAHIPVIAGECARLPKDSLGDLDKLAEALSAIVASSGGRNNLILSGSSHIDVDTRLMALAYRMVKSCDSLASSLASRQFIFIDFKALHTDAERNAMSLEMYLHGLRLLLQRFGDNNFYYLNDFGEVADAISKRPDGKNFVDEILSLFFKSKAIVIFETTPAQYSAHFVRQDIEKIGRKLSLNPLSSKLVFKALSAVARAETGQNGVSISPRLTKACVKLSRAFLPRNGILSSSMSVLKSAFSKAKDSGTRVVELEMVIDALTEINPGLNRPNLGISEVLNESVTLDEIDRWVAIEPDYYLDAQKRSIVAQTVRNNLLDMFAKLDSTLGNVKSVLKNLSGSEAKTIAEGLEGLDKKLKNIQDTYRSSWNTSIDMSVRSVALEGLLSQISGSLKHIEGIAKSNTKLAADIVALENQLLASILSLKGNVEGDIENISLILKKMREIPQLVLAMYEETKNIIDAASVDDSKRKELEVLRDSIVARILDETSPIFNAARLSESQKKLLEDGAKAIANESFKTASQIMQGARLGDDQISFLNQAAAKIAADTTAQALKFIQSAALNPEQAKQLSDAAAKVAADTTAQALKFIQSAALNSDQAKQLGDAAAKVAADTTTQALQFIQSAALNPEQATQLSDAAAKIAADTTAQVLKFIQSATLNPEQAKQISDAAAKVAADNTVQALKFIQSAALNPDQAKQLSDAAAQVASATTAITLKIIASAGLREEQIQSMSEAAMTLRNATLSKLGEIIQSGGLNGDNEQTLYEKAKAISTQTFDLVLSLFKEASLSKEQEKILFDSSKRIADQALASDLAMAKSDLSSMTDNLNTLRRVFMKFLKERPLLLSDFESSQNRTLTRINNCSQKSIEEFTLLPGRIIVNCDNFCFDADERFGLGGSGSDRTLNEVNSFFDVEFKVPVLDNTNASIRCQILRK